MIKIELSHWSRRLLVFFPNHLGVEGFVIHGWDLSNMGYSPYMTNLGDKSRIIIIRDVFHHGTWVNRGPYSTKPGICHIWGGVSYMGGVCRIWAPIYSGTVMKYVANMTLYPYMTNPPTYDKPPHIWQIPPRYDKPHPYMTNPIVYFFVRVTP